MSQSREVETLRFEPRAMHLQNVGTLPSLIWCLERSIGFLLNSQGLLPLCHASHAG